MDCADWGQGPAQRHADQQYGRLQRLIYARHGYVSDLREFVRQHYPDLMAAADGLNCPALDAMERA